MTRLFFFVALSLITVYSHRSVASPLIGGQQDGKEAAGALCANLSPSSRTDCLATVRETYFIDPNAVRVCAGGMPASSVTECLKAAANRSYTAAEAANCQDKPWSAKAECLNSSGVKVQTPPRTEAESIEAAASVCKGLSFENDRNRCFTVLRGATHVDYDAATICGSLSFASSGVDCVGAILNKSYASYEINQCRNQSFDADKVKCMRQFGKPWAATAATLPPASATPSVAPLNLISDRAVLQSLRSIQYRLKNYDTLRAYSELEQLAQQMEKRISYQ